MGKIIIASARHDERGRYTGGTAGDQLQKKTDDFSGEVSMQEFYEHYKGWMVSRPKSYVIADGIASSMRLAANNKTIGYSQYCQRKTPDSLDSSTPINVDCSKLIRDAVYRASGKDPGNFTTANEVTVLANTGLFEKAFKYKNAKETPLYDGDILTTCTKGHTVAVVEGNDRPDKLKALQDAAKQAEAAKAASTTSTTNTSTTTTAKTTTATSSAKVESAKNKSKLYNGTFRVTASSLNLRAGAGTSKAIITTLPKGVAVFCYGYYTTYKGTPWLLIEYKENGKTYTGFASKNYLLKI